jgi:hypothetical protein
MTVNAYGPTVVAVAKVVTSENETFWREFLGNCNEQHFTD